MYRLKIFIICLAISGNVFATIDQSHETKLVEQFERYDAARQHIIQKVGREGGLIHRNEWEALLKPSSPLSAVEKLALEKSHDRVCELNAKVARAASIIDLNKLRRNKKYLQQFCEQLPKGGMLHVHLSGTIDRGSAHILLQKSNPLIDHATLHKMIEPWLKPHEYDFLKNINVPTRYLELDPKIQNQIVDLFVLPTGNDHSFDRFVGLFYIQGLYRNEKNSLAIAEHLMQSFLARAREHGVMYVEFNNHPIADYPLTAETMTQLAAHVPAWEEKYGVIVRFNYAFHRGSDPEVARQQAKELLALDSPYITGIDLLGDETNDPALEKGQTVYATVAAANADGRKVLQPTMHAGELGDSRNPRDAILLGARRIGHGVELTRDIIVLEYALRQQLGVEINIVSNQRLGVHQDPKNHPFLRYLRLGLKPSLSTDDEGMFETDISREFFEAIATTDISYAEVKQLVLNSIDTAFVDPTTKISMQKKLLKQLSDFEKRWI